MITQYGGNNLKSKSDFNTINHTMHYLFIPEMITLYQGYDVLEQYAT